MQERLGLPLILCLLFVGCSPGQTGSATGATSDVVVRGLIDVWNTQELAGLDTLLAEAAVYEDMAIGFRGMGVEQIRGFLATTYGGFPDFQVQVLRMVSEGEWVATEWQMTGTHEGELGGLSPTGRRISIPGLSLTRVEEGKITEHRDYYDEQEFLRQLGAVGEGVDP